MTTTREAKLEQSYLCAASRCDPGVCNHRALAARTREDVALVLAGETLTTEDRARAGRAFYRAETLDSLVRIAELDKGVFYVWRDA